MVACQNERTDEARQLPVTETKGATRIEGNIGQS